jgi:hypothetical protein
MFKKGSLLRRRPSASMVVATLALFVALSGGAYAAVAIPNDSVGFKQLKPGAVGFRDLAAGSVGFKSLANNAVGTKKVANNAITYTKIAPGQIGHARVAQSQIQWRVTGKCSTSTAIASVSDTGTVTCTPTLPTDYNTAGLSEPLTSSTNATVLASESIPAGGAYQVTATPYIQVNGGTTPTENVQVNCEIAAGTTTETHSATFALGTNHEQQAASIPLSVDLPAQSSATEAAVVCTTAYSGASAPTVQASSSMDALQVASFQSATTPGTSTTSFTLTAPTPGTAPTTTTGTTTTGTTTTSTTTTG